MNIHQVNKNIHTDGSAQDCSNSRVLVRELLQSCTEPSILAQRGKDDFCSHYKRSTAVYFTEVYSSGTSGSAWQLVSIGLGNGLTPNRWQAITWSNDDPIHWCTYMSLGLNVSKAKTHYHNISQKSVGFRTLLSANANKNQHSIMTSNSNVSYMHVKCKTNQKFIQKWKWILSTTEIYVLSRASGVTEFISGQTWNVMITKMNWNARF